MKIFVRKYSRFWDFINNVLKPKYFSTFLIILIVNLFCGILVYYLFTRENPSIILFVPVEIVLFGYLIVFSLNIYLGKQSYCKLLDRRINDLKEEIDHIGTCISNYDENQGVIILLKLQQVKIEKEIELHWVSEKLKKVKREK